MAGPDYSQPQHDIFLVLFGTTRRRRLLFFGLIASTLSFLLVAKDTFLFEPSNSHHPSIATKNETLEPLPLFDFATEPVVFSLIMWSEDAAAEGALLLKTVLMYSTRPSDFHIICDDSAERLLRSRLDLVENPLHHVRVWFYKPTWQSMSDRVEREGSIKTDHSAGLPGLMKLFIHEILPPTVKKSIYIDTDALFIANPVLLWDSFASLRPSTAIVMASHPDQDSPEWHHASRICSCVMLLDLEKLRHMRLMDSSIYREYDDFPALAPEAFRAKYGSPKANGRYNNVHLGDQGYWWAIVDHRPDLFEPLSYDFEVTSCLLDTYLTGLGNELTTIEEELSHQIHTKDTPQEGVAVLPKLLHFNCLHGTPKYMEWSGWSDPSNSLTVRWGPAFWYHSGYKWIWLNQGQADNSKQRLDIISFPSVIFADELMNGST